MFESCHEEPPVLVFAQALIRGVLVFAQALIRAGLRWIVYLPPKFAPSADDTAAALARAGFAQLVTRAPSGLIVTPLPLLYDRDRHALGRLVDGDEDARQRRGSAWHGERRGYLRYKVMMLPLSDDSATVTQLIGLALYEF